MKNNVQFENVMVFKNEFDGRAAYSLGISGKKYQSDDYITAYLNVQFNKCKEASHKQKIDIVKSFLAPYPGSDGKGKLKLVIQKWRPREEYDDVPY